MMNPIQIDVYVVTPSLLTEDMEELWFDELDLHLTIVTQDFIPISDETNKYILI